MRARPTLLALASSLALLALTGGSSMAGLSPAEAARRSTVVFRIGSREVTTGEVEDRLANVPRFQLQAMGTTPDEVRRKFVSDILVPEVLIAFAAEKQHLDEQITVKNNLRRALAGASIRVAKAKVGPINSITKDEIRAYYAENRSRFDTPIRYNVWRILCAKREEAVAVLDAARASLTVDTFTKLAREHSVDKATDFARATSASSTSRVTRTRRASRWTPRLSRRPPR